jgi:hypothetical protein
MATETIAENQVWPVNSLVGLLNWQDQTDWIHLVITDGETGEVVVTSRFSVEKNGNNLTFIGVRDNPRFPKEQS